MKSSLLLFGIMLTFAAPIDTVWGAESVTEKATVVKKKPAVKKKPTVKKLQVVKKPAAIPTSSALLPAAVAPIAAPVVVLAPPTPAATGSEAEAPAIPAAPASAPAPVVTGAVIVAPASPTIVMTPLPAPAGNPYLQPVMVVPTMTPPQMVVVPASPSNPLGDLKSALFSVLPDGLGQMHAPIFWKLIRGTGKPLLLVQVSCPTKALFGVDTPVVAVLQLGVDQLIAMANDSNLLPAEIQKVCK